MLNSPVVSYRLISASYTPEDLPRWVFIPLTFVVPNCEVTVSVLSSSRQHHILITYFVV